MSTVPTKTVDLELARMSFYSELEVIGEDLRNDIAMIDRWFAMSMAAALSQNENPGYLMKIKVRHLVRRNTFAVHAAHRVSQALQTYMGDIQFLTGRPVR